MLTRVFIPIDRTSIRKNPRAGHTSTMVPTTKWAKKIVVAEYGPMDRISEETYQSCGPVTELANGKLQCDNWIMTDSWKRPDRHHRAKPPTVKEFFEQGQDVVNVHHHPLPQWLYSYVATQIACENCGATFPHTELQSDCYSDGEGGDICVNNLCPKCGAEAADIEFERIENVTPLPSEARST